MTNEYPRSRSSSITRRMASLLRARPSWYFELASASRLLTDQLGTLDLKGFGADELPLAICAAGALLQYVRDTQKSAVPHIRGLSVEDLLLGASGALGHGLHVPVVVDAHPVATLLDVVVKFAVFGSATAKCAKDTTA